MSGGVVGFFDGAREQGQVESCCEFALVLETELAHRQHAAIREELTVSSRLITEDDVERARPGIRARMRRAVGGPVCGLGRAIGLAEGGQDDFRPSISFVSQQAACHGVGRLIAHLHGLAGSPVLDANLAQYDTFLEPSQLNAVRLRPRGDCYSVLRRPIVEKVREQRKRLPG